MVMTSEEERVCVREAVFEGGMERKGGACDSRLEFNVMRGLPMGRSIRSHILLRISIRVRAYSDKY